MSMEVFRCRREHEDAVISAVGEDPGWHMFTNESATDNYRKRLRESIMNSLTSASTAPHVLLRYMYAGGLTTHNLRDAPH